MSPEQNSPEEFRLLEKILSELEKIKDEQVQVSFTKEEIEALKRLAAREMAWVGVGMIASSYKQIFTYLGFFIMTWLTVKGYLSEWIIELLKK